MSRRVPMGKLDGMLLVARTMTLMSEDPYVQTGAVVLRNDWTIAGTGYNGLAPGTDLSPSTWADRDARRPFMIHAEVNALRYCTPFDVTHMVTTHIPCVSCLSVIGSYGVRRVYWDHQLEYAYDLDEIRMVARHNHIELIHHS